MSSDGGSTWSGWKLADGFPSTEDAAFVEGQSYVVFSNVTAHTDGTILGEWQSTINGNSIAHRGIFNAVQIVGSFVDPIAPSFTTSPFTKGSVEAGKNYNGTLTDTVNISGTFSNLTQDTWLIIDEDGTLTGTPSNSNMGTNTFSVMVSDDLGNSDTATMCIEVTPEIIYTRYNDIFENDGLDINNGDGGGMMTYIPQASKALYFDDDGNLTAEVSEDGASRGAVHSINAFTLTDGFTLDVVYNIDLIDTTIADSATFGVADKIDDLSGLQ